ncbi:cyclic-di-AMP-binding protein CbpB [Falsibacillus pallidus]|uniref:cyclic-di-AMP-binding protein CbpB n=1 Tax=Falsibacillus pallidus TaxID=493781 RepID=UPI003D98913E
MISVQSKEFLETKIDEHIIPSEKVAHVQMGNNLEHALLLLTKSGYSAVPVLDPQYKLHGLLNSALITESILGLEKIEYEKLENKRVEEVMMSDFPRIRLGENFKKAMDLLVDNNFLCVEDEDGVFEGIFTRRTMLKQLRGYVNRLNHL